MTEPSSQIGIRDATRRFITRFLPLAVMAGIFIFTGIEIKLKSINGMILAVLMWVAGWLLAYAHVKREKAEKQLIDSNKRLESRVKARTEELSLANEELQGEIIKHWQTQIELQKVNRTLAVLSRCNEACLHIKEEEALINEICRNIVETGKFMFAWVGISEQDDLKGIRPIAFNGFEDGYIERLRVTWADTERGRGPAGTAIRTEKTCIISDANKDERFAPWREEAMMRGYSSVIGLPLFINERKPGVLVIYSDKPDFFNWEEVRLLTKLADNLSYGIKGLRTEKSRKKIEEALFNTAKGVSAETSDAFFVSLVQYLSRTLDADYVLICRIKGMNKELAETMAISVKGRISDNIEYELKGTPCEQVARKEICYYPSRVYEIFPDDRILKDFAAESYLGVPLLDSEDKAIGLLVILHGTPLADEETAKSILTIFAARASAEIERTKMEEEKRLLENELLQSQKMEAVGRLAGGIAHDFNNILTATIGFAEILKMKMPEDSPLLKYVEQIQVSSERAAALVSSLLTFSRKQLFCPGLIDINEIIVNVQHLMERLLTEDIELRLALSPDRLPLIADRIQMEQVLINLLTNARDAMPGGGMITIKTEMININAGTTRGIGLDKDGAYALITVSDTGVGMDTEIEKKIFEPFFTTKEVGKGTGLGLSIVYGIVTQHNGQISATSSPGQGTTFNIYLPIQEDTGSIQPLISSKLIDGGQETIMVVEDEPDVRMLIKTILEEYGYNVITASDGEKALLEFGTRKEDVSLVLLDVVMPKKNGREVYEELIRIRPGIKTIFMSGYASDVMHQKGVLEENLNFISKPVFPQDLLKKIREVLHDAAN